MTPTQGVMAACRACGVLKVIPVWADERCFTCASDERFERPSARAPYVYCDDEDPTQAEILELFDEAQGMSEAWHALPQRDYEDAKSNSGMRFFTDPGAAAALARLGKPAAPSAFRITWGDRRERGLCGRCGLGQAQSSLCQSCYAIQAPAARRWYQQRKRAGMCVTCGDAAIHGRVRCSAHEPSAWDRARYVSAKAMGICYAHRRRPVPVEPGTVRCRPCNERHAAGQKKRAMKCAGSDLCRHCGKPAANGLSRCYSCRAKRRAKSAVAILNGATS